MNLNDSEKLASIVVSIVTVLAIIGGGIFGLVEYMEYAKDTKIKTSLGLVTRYHTGQILKSKIKTDSAWNEVYSELTTLFKKDTSAEAYEEFVLTVVKKKDIYVDVNLIMGLFEETVICVDSGLCDKVTIDSYFKNSGRSFFNKYYPLVCDLRKKWNDKKIWLNVQTYYNPESLEKICI